MSTTDQWQKAVDADDADAAGEWLAARRSSGKKIDASQLLRIAAEEGAAKILRLLLDRGAKADAKDKRGTTALMVAAQYWSPRHHACVECLLEHGANPNARDRLVGSVLSHAFLEAHEALTPETLSLLERTVATLLQHGADASAPGASSAIVEAAGFETTTILELLLDAGASPSGSRQASALSDADLLEIANELGEEIRKLRATNQEMPTPLQRAIAAKRLAAARLLLARGANANGLLTNGRTPLLFALEKKTAELIPELLKHGADVNAPEKEGGLTPLMWACRDGAPPEVVRALLDHGARTDDVLRTGVGVRPAQEPRRGRDFVVPIEEEPPLVIEGETPLAMAYQWQRRELIDILLAHGARERGFLGVVLYPPPVAAEVQARLKLDAGAVVVANVYRHAAADLAGLQRDDAIIELDGRAVASRDDLMRIMSPRLAGDRLRCIVVRQGKQMTLSVELHPSYRCQRKYPEPERPLLGVTWYQPAELTDVRARLKLDAGAIVADVVRNSGADDAGIQRDDAIVELDEQPIAGHSDVRRIVSSKSAGDRLRCVLVRRGERIEVPVELQLRGPQMFLHSHRVVVHSERPSL